MRKGVAFAAVAVAVALAPATQSAECGAVSPRDAAGRRAYLHDEGQAITFCPDCSGKEFDREPCDEGTTQVFGAAGVCR